MTDRETRVRDIAYQMWVLEGQPEGRHDAHWYEAEAVYDAEVAGGEVKSSPPDKMALSETRAAMAAPPKEKSDAEPTARKAGSKTKSNGSSAREARPAHQNSVSADDKSSSARGR
jgi:hypothetical protein